MTNKISSKAINETVQQLFESDDPNKWIDWLAEIHHHVISTGYYQGVTESEESAIRFLMLHRFFSELRKK